MYTHNPLTTTAIDFHGWRAYRLANRFVQLVAVPDIGGRIMAYDLGTHPFLFVDPDLAGKLFSAAENQGDGSLAAWKNYGGDKTWPAPQGWETDAQWHGPPDPLLDTGRYRVDELRAGDQEATIAMTSPPDPRTGVQITRRFTLTPGSSRVRVDLSFRNISDHPIRWSIWDVVQLRAEYTLAGGSRAHDPSCTVTAPVNPQSRFPRGYNVMFGAEDNPQWQVEEGLFRAGYRWEIGKVGLDSPGGWIAFSQPSQQAAFIERFAYAPGAEYPDGGATVECWTVGAGQVANLDYANSGIYLMETEVLGPLTTLAPGATTHFPIAWGCCRCAGAVLDVQAAGCTSARLATSPQAENVHLRGGFGVFDAGHLIAVWRDAEGRELARTPLHPVNPLTALTIDVTLRKPDAADRVELRVQTADGESMLAETQVHAE